MFKKFLLILFIFVLLNAMNFAKSAPKIVKLGIKSDSIFDLCTDNTNKVHIIWAKSGHLYYGQIKSNRVVNRELIPDSGDFQMAFVRPRITARPDGSSIHLTWMKPKPGQELIHVWKDKKGWHREVVWKSSYGYYVSVPVAVEDLTGTVHIIAQLWKSESDGRLLSKIKYWYKRPGGAWNAGWTLHEGYKKWRDTAMFVDSKGGVHGVFKSGSDPGKYIYAPNGKLLKDYDIIDIPIAPGENAKCVSFGDLFVTKSGDVHHAFMTYDRKTIDYAVKKAGTDKWTNYYTISVDPLVLCEEENYKNPWPGVAVASDNTVYAIWADMQCPHKKANRITLAIKDNGKWRKKILTDDADIDEEGKPAITANEIGVYAIYREEETKDIYLFTVVYKAEVMPPLNPTYFTSYKRTIFKYVYSNNLSWKKNPENEENNLEIKSFEIYYVNEEGNKVLLGSFDSNIFNYLHYNINKDHDYQYEIYSMDKEGNKSKIVKFVKE